MLCYATFSSTLPSRFDTPNFLELVPYQYTLFLHKNIFVKDNKPEFCEIRIFYELTRRLDFEKKIQLCPLKMCKYKGKTSLPRKQLKQHWLYVGCEIHFCKKL